MNDQDTYPALISVEAIENLSDVALRNWVKFYYPEANMPRGRIEQIQRVMLAIGVAQL